MAACDANYRFTFVDVGGYGHDSDGGTFARCALGQLLEEERLEIPGEATDRDRLLIVLLLLLV